MSWQTTAEGATTGADGGGTTHEKKAWNMIDDRVQGAWRSLFFFTVIYSENVA